MADERDRWLDTDTAERLLRGEPPATIGADARARAQRLAEALTALAAPPAPSGAELPGEEAAVAAFRAARTARDDREGALGPRPADRSADAGLVRLGRPGAGGRRVRRWRTARFGLAAMLAAGTIGGVALAAGTGVLPTPFHHGPAPAASVSPAMPPPAPSLPPAPDATRTNGSSSPALGGARGGSGPGAARDGSSVTGGPGTGDSAPGRSGDRWAEVRSSCRALADGKALGTERLRDLADAAGGSGRVKAYCRSVLGDGEGSGQDGSGTDRSGSGTGDGGNGSGGEGGEGGEGGSHSGSASAVTSLGVPQLLAAAQPPTAPPSLPDSGLGAAASQ